jgi:hypothetical protein
MASVALRRIASHGGAAALVLLVSVAVIAPTWRVGGNRAYWRSAQGDTDVSLFLIGDAGGASPDGDPVLRALTREAAAAAARNHVIVFLGDNIYPHGLPDSLDGGRAAALQRIDAELRVGTESGAQLIFVPGNHDWGSGHDDGSLAIRREGAYVDHADCAVDRGVERRCASLLPANGCPGPAVVDVGQRLRLVLLDTEWWLEHRPKPTTTTNECPATTGSAVTKLLRLDIAQAGERRVVVAAHHPVVSGGVHGEPVRWSDPRTVPAALARRLVRSDQDFSGARNQALRAALDSIFAATPPFAFASGHDHGLQVIRRDAHSPLFLVSGGGTYHHLDRVEPIQGTRYEAHESGYIRLDLLTNDSVRLVVRVVDGTAAAHDAYTEVWP